MHFRLESANVNYNNDEKKRYFFGVEFNENMNLGTISDSGEIRDFDSSTTNLGKFSKESSVRQLASHINELRKLCGTSEIEYSIYYFTSPQQESQREISWKVANSYTYKDGEKGWKIACGDGNARTVVYAKDPNLSYAPYAGKHTNWKYFSTLDAAAKYSCNGD